MEMNDELNVNIPEFYRGRSIFVTGFTGAIGKVLVEKLLYSCPEIDKIYVLIRPKKDEDARQRTQQVFQSKAFSRVREKYPGALETKVIPVSGDVSLKNLGLSKDDSETIRNNVSIIFHGAALVKMTDPLSTAFKMNTFGTKEIVDLALTLHKLDCLVYISTAYTNSEHIHVKEELYPPKDNWRDFFQINEKIDKSYLHILSMKYIDKSPNTYVFTKSLSEHIINDYRDRLPVVIVRPSIVIPSLSEPIPGWTDNKYGPIAYAIGFFFGIVRCSFVDTKQKCNYVCSDYVVNPTIAVAWKTALTYKSRSDEKSVTVYNMCSPQEKNFTHDKLSKMYKEGEIVKCLNDLKINWMSLMFVNNSLLYWIHTLYRQLLPAAVIDFLLILAKKKPQLVALRRKVYIVTNTIYYFASTTFVFDNERYLKLMDDLKPEDRDEFGWDYSVQLDYLFIYHEAFKNLQSSELKPIFDNLPLFRKLFLGLYLIDRGAVFLIHSLAIWFLYAFSIPQQILSFLVGLVYF